MPKPSKPTLAPYTDQLPDLNNPATWAERTEDFWTWTTGDGYTNMTTALTYSDNVADYLDTALAGSETIVDSLAAVVADYYNTHNILGVVSQSGGVPTGAIIQRSSNANGEFVRFADGTQICSRVVRVDLSAGNGGDFDYPASFTDVNGGAWSVARSNLNIASEDIPALKAAFIICGTSQWRFRTDGTGSSDFGSVNLLSFGRWF